MNSQIYKSFAGELEKLALIERLVRLGATDIPKTPRLLMKHRNPEELHALQNSVAQLKYKTVDKPILAATEPLVNRFPTGRPRAIARKGAELLAEDPFIQILGHAIPVPGSTLVLMGGRKMLEKAIDRTFPLKLNK